MKSEGEEEAAGLNQRCATSYRPLSTTTILDSQLVMEVMDVELHGAGYVEMGCWNAVGQLCIVLNCCRIITFRAVQQLSACSSSCSHFGTCQTKRRINTRSRFLLEPSTKPEYVSETRRNEPNRDFMMPIRDMDHGFDMPNVVLDVATAGLDGFQIRLYRFTSTDAMHYPLFLHPLW